MYEKKNRRRHRRSLFPIPLLIDNYALDIVVLMALLVYLAVGFVIIILINGIIRIISCVR